MNICTLDELLQAISNAVSNANSFVQKAAKDSHKEFFNSSADGILSPKTIPMLLPNRHVINEDGKQGETESVQNISESTLTHHNQIVLDTMTMDIDCLVEELQENKDGPALLVLKLGGDLRGRSSVGRLNLSFKTSSPPEGVARLNDELLKST
ncbi:hypothetical protein [Undibacterium sp. RuTC16W]|uniref:hypothetical protein n=1 Tax=Undibacterium sp. RuTC16W TaxID=3413048 RepID=UPI003BF35EE0